MSPARPAQLVRGRGLGQSSPDLATIAAVQAATNPAANTEVDIASLPVWLWPPVGWQNVDLLDYVALPAIGATAIILQFQVPIGYNGVIKKVANNYVGAGWTEGTGELIWSILVDGTAPPGASSYATIFGSLGSPANPVEIPGFTIFENQTLTVVIQNVSVAVAGQLSGARLIGYLYPIPETPDETWG